MKYLQNILEATGHTPLVKLNRVTEGLACTVLAKVEALNPGGSIKDRPALYMLEQAEKLGLVAPGATIIEPTSGNTGIGLAQACAVKGYRAIFVISDKMSPEKVQMMEAFGAQVVITPANVESSDPRSYQSVADRLTQEIPGAYQPSQFRNPNNPLAHYLSTGPEIWDDTEGKVTHFVAGMGTGGTISGVARRLKELNPAIQVIGADPEGSIYSGGDTGKPYLVEGIGLSCVPDTIDLSLIDRMERVNDKESFLMARRLTREEGLFSGGSSGTAVVAALRVAKALPSSAVVVVILPGSGRAYMSKLYSDRWMIDQGFMESAPAGPLPAFISELALPKRK